MCLRIPHPRGGPVCSASREADNGGCAGALRPGPAVGRQVSRGLDGARLDGLSREQKLRQLPIGEQARPEASPDAAHCESLIGGVMSVMERLTGAVR